MNHTIGLGGHGNLRIIRNGKTVHEFPRIGNMLLNRIVNSSGTLVGSISTLNAYTFDYDKPNYLTPNGTFQIAAGTNILTRVTGTGEFVNGTGAVGLVNIDTGGDVGNEIRFADGTRCNIVGWTNATTVTVSRSFPSGVPPQAITIYRRNICNTNTTATNVAGYKQTWTLTAATPAFDRINGIGSTVWSGISAVSPSAYLLRTILVYYGASYNSCARIVLPTPIQIQVDDQIQFEWTLEQTFSGRRLYSVPMSSLAGWPWKYDVTAITGNGTYFGVTTATDHHFLAGDLIDLPLATTVPKRFAIASGSSTADTITVNTTHPHGLSPGDSVEIENTSVPAYNGTWTLATASGTTMTIASAANPGVLGQDGTVRLTTPATYFGGEWTVASVPTSTSVRVTSAVSGPAVDDTAKLSSPDRMNVECWGGSPSYYVLNNPSRYFSAANQRAVPAIDSTGGFGTTGGIENSGTGSNNSATYSNEWVNTRLVFWNPGVAETRIKQIATTSGATTSYFGCCVTLATPQPKPATHRMDINFRDQFVFDIPS
jgi:hypothetical protein